MIDTRIWAVVPAAGEGRRMGADQPKQYLPVQGKPILMHTLERLCDHPRIFGVVLCVGAADRYWEELKLSHPRLRDPVAGGPERVDSVLNGLRSLESDATPTDWVMVHDGVRPCVRGADIDALIESAVDDGAVLGLPLTDTVKRTNNDGAVLETVPRASLWRAQTPQMFPLAALRAALERSIMAGGSVTDESAAMERMGKRPVMVAGHWDNIKITTPQDLSLAELYMEWQRKE